MSFRFNDANNEQVSLFDTYSTLTEREKRMLEKSWAKYFGDHIFPAIDEAPFAVLYSDAASRPNTPVNVIVGALILKEMTGQSDEEILSSLLFDVRYQYALHTTSFDEQPMSDRTLGRFRARCLEYEEQNHIDLIHDAVTSLSDKMARAMKIDPSLKRMDSMMVESNIKRMSRLELLYTCVANMVEMADRLEVKIPEELAHYLKSDDHNLVIYHNRSEDTGKRIETVLSEAKILMNLCENENLKDTSEYQLLARALREQTVCNEDGSYRLKTAEDKAMSADILQNPADPDATYRTKANKEHRGYAANIIEESDENGSIVTGYQYEENTYSDSQFAKDLIDEIDPQDSKITVVADGAYSGEDINEAAAEKNVEIITTNLTGKKPNDIHGDFEFNEDGTRVIQCPNGVTPKSCSYSRSTGQCHVSFHKEDCERCPFRDQCQPKEYAKTCKKIISISSKNRALQFRKRKTEEFKRYSSFRNGVETIPSILRRKYNVDKMPVRGKLRTKQLFGFKIAAVNATKFCSFLQSLDDCAPIPVMG